MSPRPWAEVPEEARGFARWLLESACDEIARRLNLQPGPSRSRSRLQDSARKDAIGSALATLRAAEQGRSAEEERARIVAWLRQLQFANIASAVDRLTALDVTSAVARAIERHEDTGAHVGAAKGEEAGR